MRNLIRKEIKRLSAKAFLKKKAILAAEEKYREKFRRRTGIDPIIPDVKSESFVHKHFDPAHCKRNANVIATAIWKKILNLDYKPQPAQLFEVPKVDGSKRQIMAFGIPDAALANVLLRITLERNKKRLSPHSYAYHPDKNVFDAIIAINDFDNDGKLFVVQIDFQRFFDNIPSNYLKKKINDMSSISLTKHEKHIFQAFMHHQYASKSEYVLNSFKKRVRGTPQGSSVSLILANIANHDLDRKLAAEAGKFVRFADDVVAVCGTYEEAQRLERCFDRHCQESGLVINRVKSPGIAIHTDYIQEMRSISDFTYLGYSFDANGLAMPWKTSQKLRQKISRLINIYLLNALKFGFNISRASTEKNYDWDLLGLIYEIRRGLYGGLTEDNINKFIYGGKRLPKMRGLMGYYCLIEDPKLLKSLDGWMINCVRRAVVERNRRLKNIYGAGCPTPSDKELIIGSWLDRNAWRDKNEGKNDHVEVAFPSLIRGWRAARKHFFTYGLQDVQAPGYNSSMDIASLFDVLEY